MKMFRTLVFFFTFLCYSNCQDYDFSLNILHYNDFHARFVETDASGSVCSSDCIGGFARLATAVREGFEREPESLLLNAGDSFQGTIWYNLLRWNVTQEFMNMLPHDAHVLGNHEFDNGIDGVVPYIEHLNAPVVTANIDDSLEPDIQGIYNSSIVVERNGTKIGIIGVLISSTNTLASTGQLVFKDEIETVKSEAQKLHDEGVNIIIVLSHCGYEIDQDIAANAGPYIDIIVGGHSHSLLYNGVPPEGSAFTSEGPYPTVVNSIESGLPVLIVQAAAHTQYLGEIKLHFNEDLNLVAWEGLPHYLGNEIEQAEDVLEKINYYLPQIEALGSEVLGSTLVTLSSDCACAECNLGNLICDAFLEKAMDLASNGSWNYAYFCVTNQGGIRASVPVGEINFEALLLTTPFENNVEIFDLRGDYIMEMLEFAVSNDPYAGATMLQVSGLHVVYDGALELGSRVLNVSVRCIDCEIPRYEPLDVTKTYRIVSQSFLGGGGDGFSMISDYRENVEVIGVDYAILQEYIKKRSPIYVEIDGRITISNACS